MSNLENGRDLFQLQTQLIDGKIDLGVKKASDRIIDNISQLKSYLDKRFNYLESEISRQISMLESSINSSSKPSSRSRDLNAPHNQRIKYFLFGFITSVVICVLAVSQFHI